MSMKIDYDEITKLVSFLEEKNLTQFELEVEGFKIKIRRGAAQPSQAVPAPVQTAPPQPTSTSGSSLDFAKAPESSNNNPLRYVPMVGRSTAPRPGLGAVRGDREQVKKSQTLCIIEAMKLMNEIESDRRWRSHGDIRGKR